MELILISYPDNFDGEYELLTKLFEEGLAYFHLRKPDFNRTDLENYINHIPKLFHSRIIIHSHFDLVNHYKLKGIHGSSKTKHLLEMYKKQDLHKSISAHSFQEILKLDNSFEYAFLSPVFDSISKPGYQNKFNLDEVSKWLQTAPLKTKVVALGGITSGNIDLVKDTGFHGAAVLGTVWENYIKHKSISRTIDLYKELKESCS